MRSLLESKYEGKRIYLFTTQGHTYAGVLEEVSDEHVQLVAPDGATRIEIALTDVSGVRAYDEEKEVIT